MFFDDRLATVLGGPVPSDSAARVQYIQLVDILAQQAKTLSAREMAAGLARIHQLRGKVTEDDRVEAIQSLSGRIKNAPLVQYLAADAPAVASIAIGSARLSDEDWAILVPGFTTRARGFLRSRRDIGPMTAKALASYGAGDMVLTTTAKASTAERELIETPAVTEELESEPDYGDQEKLDTKTKEVSAKKAGTKKAGTKKIGAKKIGAKKIGEREIGKIVARIEALRKTRSSQESIQLPLGDEYLIEKAQILDRFGFEANENGDITWTDGELSGAICGTNIARPALENTSGPNAYAASAFQQRMPMDGARLQLRGSPLIAGTWRIDAQPFFDKLTGRFRGFRGEIRRPVLGEEAAALRDSHRSDAVRQLIHELRTPLNAIQGFAEIIEQQLFGPAAYEYRSLASEIMQDAHFMLAGFEDLDTALKLDRQVLEIETGHTTPEWLASRIDDRLMRGQKDGISDQFMYQFADDFSGFGLDQSTCERMVLRLLSTLVTVSAPDETLYATFNAATVQQSSLMLVTLPSHMVGRTESELCDPDFTSEDATAPVSLLGAGFSLRLVRNLAKQAGGEMSVRAKTICLTLPSIENNQDSSQEIALD